MGFFSRRFFSPAFFSTGPVAEPVYTEIAQLAADPEIIAAAAAQGEVIASIAAEITEYRVAGSAA